MRWFASITLFFLVATTAQAQPLTVEDALSIRSRVMTGSFSGRAEWNAMAFYLQGVIEGAAGYQQALKDSGKSPLFCPPADKGYSVEEIISILNKSSKKDRKRPATKVIMEAYARKYPCEKE